MAECAPGAGKLCGAIFVDEAFDKRMLEWIGPRKWKKFADAPKRQWKDTYWERWLKRNFDGADQEHNLALPLQIRVNENIRFSGIFHRGGRRARPQIRSHELRL